MLKKLITTIKIAIGDINALLEAAHDHYKKGELPKACELISAAINSKNFKFDPSEYQLIWFTPEQLFEFPVIETKTEDAYSIIIFYWINFGDYDQLDKTKYVNHLDNLLFLVKGLYFQLSQENFELNPLTILFNTLRLCYIHFPKCNEPITHAKIYEIERILKTIFFIPRIKSSIEAELDSYVNDIENNNNNNNNNNQIISINNFANYYEKYAKIVINWHTQGKFISTPDKLLSITTSFPEAKTQINDPDFTNRDREFLEMFKTVQRDGEYLTSGDQSIQIKQLSLYECELLLRYHSQVQIDITPIIAQHVKYMQPPSTKLFLEWLLKHKPDKSFSSEESKTVLTFLIRDPELYDTYYESILKKIIPIDIYKDAQYKDLIKDNAKNFLGFFKGDKLKNIIPLLKGLELYLLTHHSSLIDLEDYKFLSSRNFSTMQYGVTVRKLEILSLIDIFAQTPINENEKTDFIKCLYENIKNQEAILTIAEKKLELKSDILEYGEKNKYLAKQNSDKDFELTTPNAFFTSKKNHGIAEGNNNETQSITSVQFTYQ